MLIENKLFSSILIKYNDWSRENWSNENLDKNVRIWYGVFISLASIIERIFSGNIL